MQRGNCKQHYQSDYIIFKLFKLMNLIINNGLITLLAIPALKAPEVSSFSISQNRFSMQF